MFMKKVEKITHTPLLCSSVYVYEYLEYEVYGVALAAREWKWGEGGGGGARVDRNIDDDLTIIQIQSPEQRQ